MSDSDESLDVATLDELKAILEEGLEELLDEYLDDTSKQLSSLRSAENDISVIESIAHTLKGSSGNLGINGVYQLCAVLEQQAGADNVVDIAASFSAIEAEFDRAKLALATYMAG